MSIEKITQNLSEQTRVLQRNPNNAHAKAVLRDYSQPTTLLLVSQAARGDTKLLVELARTQYSAEYPRAIARVKDAATRGYSNFDGLNYDYLLNSFGNVFLAHELTGDLENEMVGLSIIAEHIAEKYQNPKNNCKDNPAAKDYIQNAFKTFA